MDTEKPLSWNLMSNLQHKDAGLTVPRPLIRNGQVYGYPLRRETLSEEDVEWLRRNLRNGDWFWSWDPGMVDRTLYFNEYENLVLFKLACGSCAR